MEHHNHRRLLPRDSHAHIHYGAKRDVETQVEVVYVTMSNTGGGKVVGYKTLDDSTPTPAQAKAATTTAAQAKTTATTTPRTTPIQDKVTTSDTTTSKVTSETTSETAQTTASPTIKSDSSIATAESSTSSQTTFSTYASPTRSTDASTTGTSASASSTSSAVPNSSGMPTVTTVALLAGAGTILLVICAFAIFIYRRKTQKKTAAAYGKTEDEKHNAAGAGAHGIAYNQTPDDVPLTASDRAPRVSLRPVTQFLPNLMTAPAATTTTSTAQQRTSYSPSGLAASAVSETRKAPPPTLNLIPPDSVTSSPPTGVINTTPMATPTAIPANGGIGPNPVHRVQMDFKPSMGDELELRVGSLVRLLHEYDDGWSLCIRLDRSQQGVCPRTCLSQRPVKPRPQGPQGRPGYAPGPSSRPQSPAGNGPVNPYSPTSSPAQSPGPNARNFSPQSPPLAHPQSPTQVRPKSGVGYVKAQYRPAGETALKIGSVPSSPITSALSAFSEPSTPAPSEPSEPITKAVPPPSLRVGPPPQITAPAASDSRPGSSSGSRPQSPVSIPSPQFAPVKPSPLSNEQRASSVVVEQPVVAEPPVTANPEQASFHAM